MALIAMTTSETITYVSDKDPAKKKTTTFLDPTAPSKGETISSEIGSDATIFRLRPLDVFLMGYIYDNASELSGRQDSIEIGIRTKINQTNIEAVRHGLVGFSNFFDKNGKEVRFEANTIKINDREYSIASDATMKLLGIQLIQELAEQIKSISEVSAEEEKNSSGASSPAG